MADHGQAVLRQRACRGCHAVFWICRHCDRGHRYCGRPCQTAALREQRRQANRRHQQSPEGRADHRDRQRAYRKRCSYRWVTDTSSAAVAVPGNMPQWNSGSTSTTAYLNSSAPSLRLRVGAWPKSSPPHSPPFLRCILCGRDGTFVDPFPPSSCVKGKAR